ncbi:hypothetical protein PFWH6_2237 [Pseudomonas fluorescens WH6]|nr:hypothetical protein PFWH6_2237 [Pseudomonas fluorescens WH6]
MAPSGMGRGLRMMVYHNTQSTSAQNEFAWCEATKGKGLPMLKNVR